MKNQMIGIAFIGDACKTPLKIEEGYLLSPNAERRRPNVFLGKAPGFTLLELLISITIVGVLLFILMSVLRLGYRSVEAGEKKIESLERFRASFNLIEAQIQSEIPLSFLENGERKYYFKGQSGLLEFSTNHSLWEGESGFVLVSYRVEEEGQGKWSLWAAEGKIGQSPLREVKLLGAFDKISFSYFYQDPTEESGQWLEEWTETAFRPKKIKLDLVVDGKELSILSPLKSQGGLTGLQTRPISRSSSGG
ncbi:MAG: prepilin-type N-terminal cleavage/methylation domain-containing protein [Thermodesulfobacteriota bacterium]